MTDTLITCPQCGKEIPVSEALGARIRTELEAALRRQHEQQLKAAVEAAGARVREAQALELKDLKAQLAEKDQKAREAQQRELELRRKARELETRQKELDLELQRKLDHEKVRLEQDLRRHLAEEQSLKLKEKEKQIDDLRKALEDARRKSEQGSQETQGEVLELDIQAVLERCFPQDSIRPVPKGMRGADILQEVRNGALQPCGSIIWEMKNTRNWSPAWISKLKDDQRAAGANIAVLVSVALPEDIGHFGCLDGVWVAGLQAYAGLAAALREQLLQVAFVRTAAVGREEKMELLYQYLSGDPFKHRVEAIVETFCAMEAQLSRERRAMEKLWREREKQIQRITLNTVGMYGDLRGIIGSLLPEIQALELDGPDLLQDGD